LLGVIQEQFVVGGERGVEHILKNWRVRTHHHLSGQKIWCRTHQVLPGVDTDENTFLKKSCVEHIGFPGAKPVRTHVCVWALVGCFRYGS